MLLFIRTGCGIVTPLVVAAFNFVYTEKLLNIIILSVVPKVLTIGKSIKNVCLTIHNIWHQLVG